eukprot:Hpha_TRINITY_DN13535_c0_g1::TRINITY_DN13535_c0_g1_i2::g.111577::m.111577
MVRASHKVMGNPGLAPISGIMREKVQTLRVFGAPKNGGAGLKQRPLPASGDEFYRVIAQLKSAVLTPAARRANMPERRTGTGYLDASGGFDGWEPKYPNVVLRAERAKAWGDEAPLRVEPTQLSQDSAGVGDPALMGRGAPRARLK